MTTKQRPARLVVREVPLTKLREDPGNARRHDERNLASIRASLEEFGQDVPLLVQQGTGRVIAGNGRLRAMRDLGWKTASVIIVPYTDAKATARAIIDNRTSELASWDDDVLSKTLQALQADGIHLESLGFEQRDLDKILTRISTADPLTGIDELPEQPKSTKTKPGDLWLLGDHRLLCADAGNPTSWDRLLNGKKAHCVFTDPPYGVDYHKTPAGQGWAPIRSDDKKGDDFATWLAGILQLLAKHSIRDAPWYVWHSSSTREEYAWALKKAGITERQYLIWVKPTHIMGRNHYHWQHEPCFYAAREGASPRWYGTADQGTVWRVAHRTGKRVGVTIGNGLVLSTGKSSIYLQPKPPRGKKARTVRLDHGAAAELTADDAPTDTWYVERDHGIEHPTHKPVELAVKGLRNSTRPGDLVLDAFLGSGTTLLAAEHLGRTCLGTELDPAFCDLIVHRWEKQTGRKAQRDPARRP